jgi:predicted nucleic acid-binding protein
MLVLDTNILLIKLRLDSRWANIEQTFLRDDNRHLISVVTLGELHALALKNNWGKARAQKISLIRQDFIVVDVNIDPLIMRYAEIDAYSQGKLIDKPLPKGLSARNMGKNDLWIAATASTLNIPLLTTDNDFDHLNGVFLEVKKAFI